jgi:hypothetical protein
MKLGIAGVNTRPLTWAADPLIGLVGTARYILHPPAARLVDRGAAINTARLGDQAALHGGKYACYFLDYADPSCPNSRLRPLRSSGAEHGRTDA